MRRIFSFLKLFRRDLIVLLLAIKHPDTPKKVRVLLACALLYLLSPVDILPDTLPFLGLFDDVVLIPASIFGLRHLLPGHVLRTAEEQTDWLLRHAALLALASALFVAFWCGLVLYGLYRLVV